MSKFGRLFFGISPSCIIKIVHLLAFASIGSVSLLVHTEGAVVLGFG
jgi:hypothetical protein